MSVTMADVSVNLAEREQQLPPKEFREVVFDVKDLGVSYSGKPALKGVSLEVYRNFVTAFIGPSGCGKSTFIRCFNHMNDLIPGASGRGDDPLPRRGPLRRRTSMRSRCASGSAWSSRSRIRSRSRSTTTSPSGRACSGWTTGWTSRVERALNQAALWDEVKDRLKASALSLSGGQQQRLCIARCLAVEPEVILMDEPASALDPIATTRIEDLMHELKRDYTIVVVTHNMQQAARVADMTAFFSVDARRRGAVGPASSSSTTRPRRSSPSPPTSGPRTTSPGDLARTAACAVIVPGGARTGSRRDLQEEAELVLRSLRGALNALQQQDAELADEVIAFDDEVDDRYLAIGQGIEQLLARQTPVAVDLRLVLAVLHINLGLERMADCA